MTNTNRKHSAKKKLISAIAMLTVSAVTLSTATYAWFTMNKEVSVVGMQMQAHAEEGLLINEVKAWDDGSWDEQAQAAESPVAYALRPTSTSDLKNWWHANSKQSYDEAGTQNLSGTVDVDASGNKYTKLTGLEDYIAIGTEDAGSGDKAIGGKQAETHVYYSQATFGTSGTSGNTYDEGEGFYVKYTYYLKSSKTGENLSVPAGKLGVTVNATLKSGGEAKALDNAIRVGVKLVQNGDFLIFAPVQNVGSGTTENSYTVTGTTAGSSGTTVGAVHAKTAINKTDITIPDVNTNGTPVEVYIWFEGEDQNCMSDNLTATLNAYEIDITFTDDAI